MADFAWFRFCSLGSSALSLLVAGCCRLGYSMYTQLDVWRHLGEV